MSRREDIDNAIWADPDFEALSAEATLLYLWSWTNPRCGMAGIYKVSVRAMTESKVSEGRLPAVLDELARSGFAFYADQVLWVRTRVKHLRSRSPRMASSIIADLKKLPPHHPLVALFVEEYQNDRWLREALKEASKEGIGNLSEKPITKGDLHTLNRGSLEPPGTGTGTGTSGTGVVRGSGGKEKAELPTDFPSELRPHLEAAYRVLRDLAERHGAKKVEHLSLASVVMARRHKPLVRAAHDFAAWADGKAQRRKDVVAGYRNWLDNTDDLAGVEQLDGAGSPAAVIPLRPTDQPKPPSKFAYFDEAAGL